MVQRKGLVASESFVLESVSSSPAVDEMVMTIYGGFEQGPELKSGQNGRISDELTQITSGGRDPRARSSLIAMPLRALDSAEGDTYVGSIKVLNASAVPE